MKLIDADKFLSYLIFSKHIDGLTCGEVKEAVEMCEVRVEIEQEPCDDAISRQAVLSKKIYTETEEGWSGYTVDADYIEHLPSVRPQEPKAGHWIRWYEQKETEWCIDNIPHCKCSECGKEYDPHSSQFIKYCNECGAKMQESEEV